MADPVRSVLARAAEHWGDIANVAGLLFSALAAWFARRARQAADQAKEVVFRRSLGEDLGQATKLASELATLIQNERPQLAALRVNDLISHTSYVLTRWHRQLQEPSRNNLLAARGQLEAIHGVLTSGRPLPQDVGDHIAMMTACRVVISLFAEERGTAIMAAD